MSSFDFLDDFGFEGVSDEMLALQLQLEFDNELANQNESYKQEKDDMIIQKFSQESKIPNDSKYLHDPEWELIDPCPDIRAMFQEFDKKYFWNSLGSCIVEWSKRMTICAGIFYLRGGGTIRLSEPLLKYRPRKDLVDTLLHEMIHAYLYLTRNFKDRGEHGDEFKGHMNRINKLASTTITVYHSFHDEVNYQRQHVWRCNGVCRTHPPFYGYVKRAMNRAPGKNDTWWASHQKKCSGTFEKISEPENFSAKSKGKSADTSLSSSKLNSTKSEGTIKKVTKDSNKSLLNNSSALASSKPIFSYFKSSNSPKKSTEPSKALDFKNEFDIKLDNKNLYEAINKNNVFNAKKKQNDNDDLIAINNTKRNIQENDNEIEELFFKKPKIISNKTKHDDIIVLDDC